MKELEHLMAPLRIGTLELANRVVMPPMGTGLGNPDGSVSEANLAYLGRRARSGAGLYITEITEVEPAGSVGPGCIGVWKDEFIPGLRKLAEAVHARGSKIAMQLHHCGRESYYQTKNKTAVAPSAIPSYIFGFLGTPREMTPEEIRNTIRAFGAAAVRAREAGFDAVELHGAHGYLLMQFLSAHSNRRTDEYGGDFRGRARFMIDCIREVRRRVGADFPVSIRVSGEEQIKNGYTIDEMASIAPDLVGAGVDLIHVSFGTHGNASVSTDTPNPSAPVEFAQGFKASLARRVREAAGIPVIAVGRFTDPAFMDGVIARGDADLVAVARQHLADPDFLNNAVAGRPGETLPCLACNQGCIERLAFEAKTIRCAINPETGRELIYPTKAAGPARTVWVVGAGPGGLTAALEAARLGHKVTLFEREEEVGGHVRFAAKAPHKEVYQAWIDVLASKCRKSGVEIRLGTDVTEAMIEAGRPEAVILANGSEKASCPAEGAGTALVCDAWQILNSEVAPGKRVVVIGAGLVGMETADLLREKGVKSITVVEMLATPPVPPLRAHGVMLHRRLRAAGVRLLFNTTVKKIGDGRVVIATDGTESTLEPVDQVIVAVGVTPRQELKAFLERKQIRHFIVGDSKNPRRIIEATTEGADAAWKI